MLAPIRPRPIIPSCILSAPKLRIVRGNTAGILDCVLHGLRKCVQAGLQILAEVDAQSAPAAFGENVEVAASLRGFHDTKCIFLAWDCQVGSIIAGNLQEDAAVWAALVGLSCGVQKARAKAEASGDFLFVANDVAKFLEHFFVFGVHRNVAEDGEVVACTGAPKMFLEHVNEFRAASKGRGILFVGKEFYASGFEERRLGREMAG